MTVGWPSLYDSWSCVASSAPKGGVALRFPLREYRPSAAFLRTAVRCHPDAKSSYSRFQLRSLKGCSSPVPNISSNTCGRSNLLRRVTSRLLQQRIDVTDVTILGSLAEGVFTDEEEPVGRAQNEQTSTSCHSSVARP